ncbi:MAG: tetratricopeptide repeat protein [Kiritimatiellaeota bacterium]|nr:tetratricopeptide repeat protein [Kiritimatiellota bacterium]
MADREIKNWGLQGLEQSRRAYEARVARDLFPAHSPALIGAGSLYMALGRYPEADQVYTLLAKGAPRMGAVWLNLGICKLEQGQTDAALPCLRRATQGHAGDALAWLYLAAPARKPSS